MKYIKDNHFVVYLFAALFIATAPACGDSADSTTDTEQTDNTDSEGNGNEDNPDNGDPDNKPTPPPEHACNHAQNGPFVPTDDTALTAASEKSGDVPTINHGKWTKIELNETGDTYSGFVEFEAKKSGGHRFFTSTKWPGESEKTKKDPYVQFSSDKLSFKAKHPVGSKPGCAEVNFNHFYGGFESGTSYVFEITDHPSETVFIVPVPGGAHNHG